MALTFKPEDGEQMRRVQADVVACILKYKDNTEAALVAFALVRTARILLERYPAETRAQLLGVVTPFLQGLPGPDEAEDEGRILLM